MNKGPMDGAREPYIMGQWIDQRVIEGAMDQLAIVAIGSDSSRWRDGSEIMDQVIDQLAFEGAKDHIAIHWSGCNQRSDGNPTSPDGLIFFGSKIYASYILAARFNDSWRRIWVITRKVILKEAKCSRILRWRDQQE